MKKISKKVIGGLGILALGAAGLYSSLNNNSKSIHLENREAVHQYAQTETTYAPEIPEEPLDPLVPDESLTGEVNPYELDRAKRDVGFDDDYERRTGINLSIGILRRGRTYKVFVANKVGEFIEGNPRAFLELTVDTNGDGVNERFYTRTRVNDDERYTYDLGDSFEFPDLSILNENRAENQRRREAMSYSSKTVSLVVFEDGIKYFLATL